MGHELPEPSSAERLMELEVGATAGAGYGEKNRYGRPSATAIARRTGRRGAGTVELRFPKLRKGSYFFCESEQSRCGFMKGDQFLLLDGVHLSKLGSSLPLVEIMNGLPPRLESTARQN